MEQTLIKFFILLSVLGISVIVFFITQIFDSACRKYLKQGYRIVDIDYKLTYFVPSMFFMFAIAFILVYILAAADGYVEEHPEFTPMVGSAAAGSALFGGGLIYFFKLRRIFYSKKGLIKGRAFNTPLFIESNDISHITFTVTRYTVFASIHTRSNGVINYLNSAWDGFDEFYNFVNNNWANKTQIIKAKNKTVK